MIGSSSQELDAAMDGMAFARYHPWLSQAGLAMLVKCGRKVGAGDGLVSHAKNTSLGS